MVEPTPLQEVAALRLLFPLPDHPAARAPRTLARHLLEVFVVQRKLVTGRDSGPGMDAGDILCEGRITRGAELPLEPEQPWDWLDAAIDWQVAGRRPIHQPAATPNPGNPEQLVSPPLMALQPPALAGVAWLGDLRALESPGVLPNRPRALLAGASLLTIGFSYGEGGIGAELQEALGEAITLVLKPNRVLVTSPGDSLLTIAERFGTTVQTLRRINSDLAPTDTVLTESGDTLLVLAGRHGTTVDWLRENNPTLIRWDTHTTTEGDTLKLLAEQFFTTPQTLREYNRPDLDLISQSEPLPVGMELVVPAVRPSTPLEPGQALVVPLYRPATALPAGIWLHLPKPRRSLSDPDDLSDLDTEPPDAPEPEPEPTPETTDPSS